MSPVTLSGHSRSEQGSVVKGGQVSLVVLQPLLQGVQCLVRPSVREACGGVMLTDAIALGEWGCLGCLTHTMTKHS